MVYWIDLHSAFSLVTGCTITTGCSWTNPFLRMTALSPFLSSWETPSLFAWMAVSPSSRFRNLGDRDLNACTLELTRVSPPAAAGDSSMAMKVAPGG